ncbi:hypothetical protein Cflav_PD1410 [Pedosphaera parvula Ellin514]|uniref:Uncharacterized protein n=1 Tax=Pedosphaera parvula (strain Ellin514) TaxID=320771 RepID=B9XPI2_PEDPL|nr:hypothetical protein Cflav_PD1410 [Pedosphaera parvula Ellin514]
MDNGADVPVMGVMVFPTCSGGITLAAIEACSWLTGECPTACLLKVYRLNYL